MATRTRHVQHHLTSFPAHGTTPLPKKIRDGQTKMPRGTWHTWATGTSRKAGEMNVSEML